MKLILEVNFHHADVLLYLDSTTILMIMNNELSLRNNLLIAMPTTSNPHFFRAVIYICEHDRSGAMGLIINRPLDLNLLAVLQHIEVESSLPEVNRMSILWGGPINTEQVFLLHTPRGEWESTLSTDDRIGITASRDILQALAVGNGPEQALVLLGYAGWGKGQLEAEIASNYWLTTPAVPSLLFDVAFEQRWEAAAKLLGVDFNNLSTDVGHA